MRYHKKMHLPATFDMNTCPLDTARKVVRMRKKTSMCSALFSHFRFGVHAGVRSDPLIHEFLFVVPPFESIVCLH